MNNDRLVHDASESTKGTIYQTYVAVLKCFEMTTGQRVVIEQLGDVTIDNKQQIETKLYTSPLTDNHANFWKTLRNWMQDGFDDTQYASLILYTTQQFGVNSRIAKWNEADIDERLSILEEIHRESEDRESHRTKNGGKHAQAIPESLSFQRSVLHPDKQAQLRSVIERFVIEACSPGMSALYQQIIDRYCKTILRGKRNDFLDSLLGFVISPSSVLSTSWEITFEQFTGKVEQLSPLYCHETRIFPIKYLDAAAALDSTEVDSYRNRVFVHKIRDIEYHDVISQAIQDYIGASQTVLEEFKNYEVPDYKHRNYAREVIRVFQPRYSSACRNVNDVIKESQTFFDQITAEEPPAFPGFEAPPRAFRNGVLHIQLDDLNCGLKWRLERP